MDIRPDIAEDLCAKVEGRIQGVGCGTEIFSFLCAAAPEAREGVAIDTAEEFRAAQETAHGLGLPIRFGVADFLKSFPDETFTRIVSQDLPDRSPSAGRTESSRRTWASNPCAGPSASSAPISVRAWTSWSGKLVSHGRPARASLAERKR